MVLDINNADDFYIYNNHVDKLFFQGEEIWPNWTNFKGRPLTIEPISTGGTLTVHVSKSGNNYARYSKDLSTWTDLTSGDNYINVNSGEKVYLRSIGQSNSAFSITNINTDFYYKVSGNILSLVYGDDFDGQEYIDRRGSTPQYQSLTLYGGYNLFKNSTTLLYANNLYISSYVLQHYQLNQDDPVSTYAVTPFDFSSFFEGCTSLILPPILWVLDRNNLPYNVTDVICCGSYNSMFKNCNSLLRAPYIPTGFCTWIATGFGSSYNQVYKYSNMFENCTSITSANDLNEGKFDGDGYQRMLYASEMFKGCTSLMVAPKLPKIKSSYLTFNGMFKGCTSLTTVPDIDVEIIGTIGLREMFSGCSNLNYVKCLATEINQAGMENWLYGVSPTGTFVKDANTTWPSGDSGIPSGWTVINN